MRRRLNLALLVLVALILPTACDPGGGAAPTPSTLQAPCDPATTDPEAAGATDCPPTTSPPPASTAGGETTTTEEPAETTTTEGSGETTTTADKSEKDGKSPADKPVLIALGDSITSGHHKERGKDTICEKADYGYPGDLFTLLKEWRKETWAADPDQYENLAYSGFGPSHVLRGGTTACGKELKGGEVPVTRAVKLLGDHKGAGNVVVLSAGINDTNWVEVLRGIALQVYASPKGFTPAECREFLRNGVKAVIEQTSFAGLDFFVDDGLRPTERKAEIEKKRAKITEDLTEMTRQLVAADPKVNIFVLRYYDISGTGFNDVAQTILNPEYKGPYLPASCGEAVASRLKSMNELVEAAMTAPAAFPKDTRPADRVSFVHVPELDRTGNTLILQSLFIDEVRKAVLDKQPVQPPGWPHPQRAGHMAASKRFMEAVKAKLGG